MQEVVQEICQNEMALPIVELKRCGSIFEFDDRVFTSISRGWTLVACRAVYEKEQLGLANKPTILVLKALSLADDALCDAPRLGL